MAWGGPLATPWQAEWPSHRCHEGTPPESRKEVENPTKQKNPKKQGPSPSPVPFPLRDGPCAGTGSGFFSSPVPSCATVCLPCNGEHAPGEGPRESANEVEQNSSPERLLCRALGPPAADTARRERGSGRCPAAFPRSGARRGHPCLREVI